MNAVQKFYHELNVHDDYDYADLAARLSTTSPSFAPVAIPFFGEMALALVEVTKRDGYRHDGAAAWETAVSSTRPERALLLLARPNPLLKKIGYHAEYSQWGEVVCFGTIAQVLFGELTPMTDQRIGEKISGMVKARISSFYPEELHTYPFKDDQVVQVYAADTTRIGGIARPTTGANARQLFSDLAEEIIRQARGNAHVAGHIEGGGVKWVIPAFGRPHVAAA